MRQHVRRGAVKVSIGSFQYAVMAQQHVQNPGPETNHAPEPEKFDRFRTPMGVEEYKVGYPEGDRSRSSCEC